MFNKHLHNSMADRNTKASICHSSSTAGIEDLIKRIDECTNSDELGYKNQIAELLSQIQTYINDTRMHLDNTILMGDSIFGNPTSGVIGKVEIKNELERRNTELQNKKDKLEKDIKDQSQLIERSHRDFSDVKDQLPEKLTKNKLNFIEDYTLAFLCISYLFMICVFISYHTYTSSIAITGFLQSLFASVILTMAMFILLYYMA